LAQEEYFVLRGTLADSAGGFYAIQLRKTDVQQNLVRLQLFSLLDRFQPI